jgi:hypothetical protein
MSAVEMHFFDLEGADCKWQAICCNPEAEAGAL